MSKIDLQAEIKAIQEFGKEAENLINKMNASAEKINEASDLEVQRIKKQIDFFNFFICFPLFHIYLFFIVSLFFCPARNLSCL